MIFICWLDCCVMVIKCVCSISIKVKIIFIIRENLMDFFFLIVNYLFNWFG